MFCIALVQLLTTSVAQTYEGTYLELANISNEFILTYEGDGIYSGVLFEGVNIYALQANDEETQLKGLIFKSRVGDEKDIAFRGEFTEGQLLLTTNFVDAAGGLELDNQSLVTYIRKDTLITNESLQTNSTESNSESISALQAPESNTSTTLANLSVRTGTLIGEPIQPDEQYWGGTQLKAPTIGISFQVPSAGTALHSSPAQTIVIGHTSTLGNITVTALSAGEFSSFVTNSLKIEDEQVLTPVLKAISTENSYRGAFELESGNRSSYIEVAALKGPSGNMILFKAKSRMQEAKDISQVLDTLVTSLLFAEPNTQPSIQLLNTQSSEVKLETAIENSRLTSEFIKGFLDICKTSEYRLEDFEDTDTIQIGLWKRALSLFSSGIVLSSIDGDFSYIPLEGIGNTKDEMMIEASPYCQ